jgi:steroid delta-isomerase-like uncharacterized protein
MSAKEIKALVRRWFREWNKGKAAALAAIDKFYATDFVYHSGDGRDMGFKDFKQSISAFYDAFPDLHWTLDDMVVEGDRAVTRYIMTGTHKGEFMGIPPTNKKLTVWMIEIDRVIGGKIVEEWVRYDTLGMMQQLGLTPTPGKEK